MRKGIITLGVIGIIVSLLVGFGPLVYRMVNDKGLQTASLSEGGEPASIGIDGPWFTVDGFGQNRTQAGYTFFEKLPAEDKTTSGRTDNQDSESVHGELRVSDGQLQEGLVTVDVASISSDNERRDINVRKNILHTDKYPKATFAITEPTDLSGVPEDGTVGTVKVTGDLTLHGVTKKITTDLRVLRTGESVIIEGSVPVKRSDFHIESGDFVAAVIDDEGTIDLLLVFQQRS
ncbi:YceI family protein [Corynebacterium suicordis]